jgi:hypothetical protein
MPLVPSKSANAGDHFGDRRDMQGHPVKHQMDERGFLRTALAWILEKEAAKKDSKDWKPVQTNS